MEDDDEFGDLYVDVLRPPSIPAQSLPSSTGGTDWRGASKPGALDPNFLFEDDDDEEEDGKGMFHKASDSYVDPTSEPRDGGRGEEWRLRDARTCKEEPVDEAEEEDVGVGRVSSPKEDYSPSERNEFRFSLDEEEEEEEAVEGSIMGVSRVKDEEDEDLPIPGGISSPADEKTAAKIMEIDVKVEDVDQEPVIPGLSAVSIDGSPSRGMNGSDEKISGSEDFESDSEDDLQIVLNDDSVGRPYGAMRNGAGEDEDEEEDLVIVTDQDHHHHLSVEEQDYGDELTQPTIDGERNEALDSSKGNGGISAIGSRIGYSNQGFHGQHHSQFKYIRPGAAGPPVGPTGSAPGQTRPPLAMGPMASRSRGMQKGYGAPSWGGNVSGRSYSGLDFTLPSHKTIFDVDIDGFEEKPWRIPGVDISDFFNFGLDEDSWKDYRKLLEQLRLEATMQSKIRVYESGRSEQDYDPDLPPELAAATGVQDIYSDSVHHGKADGGSFEIIGPGMGVVRSHQQLPMGRAIQVEGGYGDRLPSIDTRRPRMRDSDAIIEIVPTDSFDDPVVSNGEKDYEPDEHQRVAADSEFLDRTKPDFIERKTEMQYEKETLAGPEGKELQGPSYDIESGARGYSPRNKEISNAKECDNSLVRDDERDNNGEISKLSPAQLEEPSGDVILEGDPNEKVALDDGDDMEYEERASDLLDSNEVPKDNGSHKSIRVDQKVIQGDSRRGKSETGAKDYPRKQTEERRSSQRRERDDRGREMGNVDRHQAASKGRQDSSQSYHGRRSEGGEKSREREDAYGKRAKDEAASRQRDKDRVSEKKGKDTDAVSRKHEDLDRKRQKDRDDVKRRKDEEQRRREKDSKEHSQHGSDHRKKEDQVREGSNRHREDNLKQREKEESQRGKRPNDEGRKQKEREDRASSGGGRGSEGNSSKDRRRYPEKGTEYSEKHKSLDHRAHENQSTTVKERKNKQLKSSGDVSNCRTGDTKMEKEPQKESSRKKKEVDAGDRKPASGKRKRGDGRGQQASSSKSSSHAAQERSNSSHKGNRHADTLPDVHNLENLPLPPPPPLPFPLPANPTAVNAGSDEDNSQDAKRGRSKLERWTSQKERDFVGEAAPSESTGKLEGSEPSETSGKDKERHLETVAKLKKRSERFKVPLPGEKEVVVVATVKKSDSDAVPLVQNELLTDGDIKQERPARKRRWASSG